MWTDNMQTQCVVLCCVCACVQSGYDVKLKGFMARTVKPSHTGVSLTCQSHTNMFHPLGAEADRCSCKYTPGRNTGVINLTGGDFVWPAGVLVYVAPPLQLSLASSVHFLHLTSFLPSLLPCMSLPSSRFTYLHLPPPFPTNTLLQTRIFIYSLLFRNSNMRMRCMRKSQLSKIRQWCGAKEKSERGCGF